jgi:hypothetical protein
MRRISAGLSPSVDVTTVRRSKATSRLDSNPDGFDTCHCRNVPGLLENGRSPP